MPDRSELSKKMHALADRVQEPEAGELRELADKLDASIKASLNESGNDIKLMIGCWARARRLYSEISGEPLV